MTPWNVPIGHESRDRQVAHQRGVDSAGLFANNYFAMQSSATRPDVERRHAIRIIHAQHLGMCFGVRDAIALARERAAAGPLTILGDLVHNSQVSEDLRARGVAIV